MDAPSFRPAPGAGDRLGPYELLATVGRGATGRVFRARTDGPGGTRDVAVKVLDPLLAGDRAARARFEAESRLARALQHPNLVPILDAGEADGQLFLVMPWLPDGSLADELAFAGPLPAARLLRVSGDLASGLEALHAAGIVHRDVKPGNVMLAAHGWFALTDFGLARHPDATRLTLPGEAVGTVDYLAPEIVLGGPATPASDIYSLACLLFECVAGRAPFTGRTPLEVARAHVDERPPDVLVGRGDLPPAVGPAILRGLAKDPADRPATPSALVDPVWRAVGDAEAAHRGPRPGRIPIDRD